MTAMYTDTPQGRILGNILRYATHVPADLIEHIARIEPRSRGHLVLAALSRPETSQALVAELSPQARAIFPRAVVLAVLATRQVGLGVPGPEALADALADLAPGTDQWGKCVHSVFTRTNESGSLRYACARSTDLVVVTQAVTDAVDAADWAVARVALRALDEMLEGVTIPATTAGFPFEAGDLGGVPDQVRYALWEFVTKAPNGISLVADLHHRPLLTEWLRQARLTDELPEDVAEHLLRGIFLSELNEPGSTGLSAQACSAAHAGSVFLRSSAPLHVAVEVLEALDQHRPDNPHPGFTALYDAMTSRIADVRLGAPHPGGTLAAPLFHGSQSPELADWLLGQLEGHGPGRWDALSAVAAQLGTDGTLADLHTATLGILR